jgi:hypothetical protein
MNTLEFKPAKKASNRVVDSADIENMSEQTVGEIRAKKQAFNDLILSLDGQINMVHSESGSNSPDDDSQEQAQDSQGRPHRKPDGQGPHGPPGTGRITKKAGNSLSA